MTAVFLDAYALIGWINTRDYAHARVNAYLSAYSGRIITTEWVLLEAADALCSPKLRTAAATAIEELRWNPIVDIVPYDPATFQAGFDLYAARPDKAWSLTDCISFGVMHDLGLADALTADRHFAQAGFNPVFADQ